MDKTWTKYKQFNVIDILRVTEPQHMEEFATYIGQHRKVELHYFLQNFLNGCGEFIEQRKLMIKTSQPFFKDYVEQQFFDAPECILSFFVVFQSGTTEQRIEIIDKIYNLAKQVYHQQLEEKVPKPQPQNQLLLEAVVERKSKDILPKQPKQVEEQTTTLQPKQNGRQEVQQVDSMMAIKNFLSQVSPDDKKIIVTPHLSEQYEHLSNIEKARRNLENNLKLSDEYQNFLIYERNLKKVKKLSTLMQSLKSHYFAFDSIEGVSKKTDDCYTYSYIWENDVVLIEESGTTRIQARDAATLQFLQKYAPKLYDLYQKNTSSLVECIQISSEEDHNILYEKLKSKIMVPREKQSIKQQELLSEQSLLSPIRINNQPLNNINKQKQINFEGTQIILDSPNRQVVLTTENIQAIEDDLNIIADTPIIEDKTQKDQNQLKINALRRLFSTLEQRNHKQIDTKVKFIQEQDEIKPIPDQNNDNERQDQELITDQRNDDLLEHQKSDDIPPFMNLDDSLKLNRLSSYDIFSNGNVIQHPAFCSPSLQYNNVEPSKQVDELDLLLSGNYNPIESPVECQQVSDSIEIDEQKTAQVKEKKTYDFHKANDINIPSVFQPPLPTHLQPILYLQSKEGMVNRLLKMQNKIPQSVLENDLLAEDLIALAQIMKTINKNKLQFTVMMDEVNYEDKDQRYRAKYYLFKPQHKNDKKEPDYEIEEATMTSTKIRIYSNLIKTYLRRVYPDQSTPTKLQKIINFIINQLKKKDNIQNVPEKSKHTHSKTQKNSREPSINKMDIEENKGPNEDKKQKKSVQFLEENQIKKKSVDTKRNDNHSQEREFRNPHKYKYEPMIPKKRKFDHQYSPNQRIFPNIQDTLKQKINQKAPQFNSHQKYNNPQSQYNNPQSQSQPYQQQQQQQQQTTDQSLVLSMMNNMFTMMTKLMTKKQSRSRSRSRKRSSSSSSVSEQSSSSQEERQQRHKKHKKIQKSHKKK